MLSQTQLLNVEAKETRTATYFVMALPISFAAIINSMGAHDLKTARPCYDTARPFVRLDMAREPQWACAAFFHPVRRALARSARSCPSIQRGNVPVILLARAPRNTLALEQWGLPGRDG